MYCDGRSDGKQNAVGRHAQSCLPDALNRHRKYRGRGADSQPLRRRRVSRQASAEQGDERDRGEEGQHSEQETAVREQVQILVVRLIEEAAALVGLIDEHRVLIRA